MNHLLISCDLGWATDLDKFEASVRAVFDRVTTLEINDDFSNHDVSSVTHWIMNPAPLNKISSGFLKQHFSSLRVIGSPSTGTTHIAADVKSDESVAVYCLQDVPKADLARITSSSEHTLFLFMCLVRKAWNCLNADLTEWRADLPRFRGRQISGMRILIFGYGRIGGNVASYLHALGAELFIYEPDLNVDVLIGTRIAKDDIESHLPTVDCVFLCFHWSAENSGFFDRRYLDLMRDDSFFVNTSRGENLDEKRLGELIEARKFSGVALDVISNEQSDDFAACKLIELSHSHERLIVTPHIAGASFDSERIAFELIFEKISQSNA